MWTATHHYLQLKSIHHDDRGLQLLREWQEQKLYAYIQLFNRYCKPFDPSNLGTSSAQDGKNPHLSTRNLDTQS